MHRRINQQSTIIIKLSIYQSSTTDFSKLVSMMEGGKPRVLSTHII